MYQGNTEAFEALGHGLLDVDRRELAMSLAFYLAKLNDTLSLVQLSNNAPKRRLTHYHRGLPFDTWLLLARSSHQICMAPVFKEDFFTHFNHYQVAQPGRLTHQASNGQSLASTSVFIQCLRRAGCVTLRLKAFGQKTPLTERFAPTEPTEVTHR
jgi:hypothetical protein